MRNNLSIRFGTIGGTALSVVYTISGADILKTVVLATIGAIVSFIVSMLLKTLWQWLKR
jgi:hypothetical protein